MDSLEVKGTLRLDDATFEQIGLRGTKVGGALGMLRSTVNGRIYAEALDVGTALALGDGASFHDINMNVVKVGGLVNIAGAHFQGNLFVENLQASSNVLLQSSRFDRDVIIILAKSTVQ